MGDMKIGEGKKFDASQVSAEGLTKEEINEITKKNKRLIKIFQAYDTDGKAGLSSSELAAAMDDFIKAAGEDGKISKKEFQKMADEFNKWNEFSGGKEVSGEDLKKFMKSIKKATKRDEKVSTQQVLDAERQKTEAWIKQNKELFPGALDATILIPEPYMVEWDVFEDYVDLNKWYPFTHYEKIFDNPFCWSVVNDDKGYFKT